MPPYSIFENLFRNNPNWYHEDDNVVKEEKQPEYKEPVEDNTEWFKFDEKEFSMTDKDERVRPLVRKEFLFDNEFELLHRLIDQAVKSKSVSSRVFGDLDYILTTDRLSVRCDISRKKDILEEIKRVRFLQGKTLEQERAYSMAVKIIDKLFIEDGEFKEV